MKKYILTLVTGKYLKVKEIGGTEKHLPIGLYKVIRSGNYITVAEVSKNTEEFTAHYSNLMSDPNTSMFNSLSAAISWFDTNFFVEASGIGGVETSAVFPMKPVASRLIMPNQNFFSGTTPTKTYRTNHLVTHRTGFVRLMWVNQSQTGNASNAFTLTASIQGIPTSGTNISTVGILQLKFNGATSISVPVGGYAISDPLWLPMDPINGAFFLVRTGVTSAASSNNWPVGLVKIKSYDGRADGDQTMNSSETFAESSTTMYAPSIIGGEITQKSFAGIGDSIMDGSNDTINNRGWFGYLAENYFLSTNRIAVAGERVSSHKTLSTPRWQLITQANYVISQGGTNDIGNGDSASTLKANLIELWNNLNRLGKKVIQTTILPRSTSSDNFITDANQTLWTYESVRVDINTWLKDGAYCTYSNGIYTAAAKGDNGAAPIPYLYRVIDICPAVESTTIGKWKVGATLFSSTCTGGATASLTDTGVNFNSLTRKVAGAFIRILTGNAAGQVNWIVGAASNTQVNVLNNWGTVPNSGCTYEIIDTYTRDNVHPSANAHLDILNLIAPIINSLK